MLRVLPCAVLCWLVYYGVLVCCAVLSWLSALLLLVLASVCAVMCCAAHAVLLCAVCASLRSMLVLRCSVCYDVLCYTTLFPCAGDCTAAVMLCCASHSDCSIHVLCGDCCWHGSRILDEV